MENTVQTTVSDKGRELVLGVLATLIFNIYGRTPDTPSPANFAPSNEMTSHTPGMRVHSRVVGWLCFLNLYHSCAGVYFGVSHLPLYSAGSAFLSWQLRGHHDHVVTVDFISALQIMRKEDISADALTLFPIVYPKLGELFGQAMLPLLGSIIEWPASKVHEKLCCKEGFMILAGRNRGKLGCQSAKQKKKKKRRQRKL